MNTQLKIPIEGLISHSYLLLLNSDGTIIFMNEMWRSVTGNNKVINSAFDLVGDLDSLELKTAIEWLASNTGNTKSLTLTISAISGTEEYFDARLYSYFYQNEVRIIVIADNISDKIKLTNRLLFGFENSNDVIYELDILKRRYNYVSPACYELFEITQEEALNTRPGSLEYRIHSDDYNSVRDHFRKICKQPGAGKKSFYVRYRYYHSIQGMKWVIDRHTVFYNNKSQPFLLIGNIRDITDLQLSYDMIARSERMFKGLIQNSIDIISMLDRNGIIKFISPSVEPILGYKPEEIINKHPFEFMDSSMHEEVSATMKKLFENPGKVIESEMYFKYKSGRDVFLKSKFINYLDEPHIQSILGSTHDITEQKLYEQKLKDSYAGLHQIINNTDDPIWSVDTDMKLTVFNQSFACMIEQFFGFTPQIGQHLFDAVVEHGNPDQAECRQQFQEALTGKKIRFERVYELGDRQEVMDYSVSPLFNSEGQVTGVTCFGRSITEKVSFNQQLNKQNEELKKANREMDRFVYSMSHDLRSPVASALGLIQVMELEHENTDSLKHIHMIRKRLSRLDTLIDDILLFVKQRKEDFKPELINVRELIEYLMENRGFREETQNLNMEININDEIPIVTDKAKLTVVLENLISNAIKYRDYIKDKLKLNISCFSEADQVCIQVSDNGIGIAEKHKEKVFDMFFRATTLSNGSGLGLYIVKECLETMNGSIHLDSVLMEGTTFTIKFKNYFQSNLINLNKLSNENYMDYR